MPAKYLCKQCYFSDFHYNLLFFVCSFSNFSNCFKNIVFF